MNDYLAAATSIVRDAGDRARLLIADSRVRRHKAHGDIVTDGDLAVEEHVISALRERFPRHGFLSEERGAEDADAEYVWVLDPIDGTKYYARNVPLYTVSLALERSGEPVCGVVYNPECGRIYSAARGDGATLATDVDIHRGRPIECSKEHSLEKATLCVEIPSKSSSDRQRRWALGKMSDLVDRAFRVRVLGAGAMALCLCAEGGFDAYVNLGSAFKHCDYAAGRIIVEESGGRFYHMDECLLAGPSALCSEIRSEIGV